MPQKTADKTGYLVLAYSQAYQAISIMTKISIVETKITSEEGYWR
jgi:hypothetical protein